MQKESLIKVDGLGKKYCRSLKKSIVYGVKDIFSELSRNLPTSDVLRPHEFWALKDISFELNRGECLGLIGPNGAGKSTLLKLLNGIIYPDAGTIKSRGKVVALIELGAGFHPMLTGRENIYLMGSIYGMSNDEIREKYQSIVEFSELGDFIESPVKYYSSGMRVRLGFSIAIHLEPDILFLDEVLAVGDIGFRTKCFNAIGSIRKKAAVILVSHSMPQIARMADHVMILDKGRLVNYTSDVPSSITNYYSLFDNPPGIKTVESSETSEIISTVIQDSRGENFPEVESGCNLRIKTSLNIDPSHIDAILFIGIMNQELQLIAQASTEWDNIHLETGRRDLETVFRELSLNPSKYYLLTTLMNKEKTEILSQHYAVNGFVVNGKDISYSPFILRPEWQISN